MERDLLRQVGLEPASLEEVPGTSKELSHFSLLFVPQHDRRIDQMVLTIRPIPAVRPKYHGCAMKLPGGDAAIVDREKLTGYCLNPEHPRGKHKARVFATALGFTGENADELRAALLTAAATADARPAASDRFGDRYVVEFDIVGPRGAGVVRSTWIVRRGEVAPRLTSCFVK
jgi:hypothetical protein